MLCRNNSACVLSEAMLSRKISLEYLTLARSADSELVTAALHDGPRGYVLKTEAESDLLPVEQLATNTLPLTNRFNGR